MSDNDAIPAKDLGSALGTGANMQALIASSRALIDLVRAMREGGATDDELVVILAGIFRANQDGTGQP